MSAKHDLNLINGEKKKVRACARSQGGPIDAGFEHRASVQLTCPLRNGKGSVIISVQFKKLNWDKVWPALVHAPRRPSQSAPWLPLPNVQTEISAVEKALEKEQKVSRQNTNNRVGFKLDDSKSSTQRSWRDWFRKGVRACARTRSCSRLGTR